MKILIIEDEKDLSNDIVEYLSMDIYKCEQAFNYHEALDKICLYSYDCILLDLNLPGGEGLKILDEIKKQDMKTGIIIISARGEVNDRVLGIQTGADDYLVKPFSLSELSVRIYALMRRVQFTGSNIMKSNNIEIDLLSKQIQANGQTLNLTKSEYNLLLFLIGNKKRVVSKNSIAEHLKGDMADMLDNQDFVYAHLKNLKSKLNEADCLNCIKTIYGTGYQWVE